MQGELVGAGTMAEDENLQALQTGDAGGAKVDAEVQDCIGDRLRESYEDLLDAPLPERLTSLLAELKRKEVAT